MHGCASVHVSRIPDDQRADAHKIIDNLPEIWRGLPANN
jgi:hypothetical protein